MLTYKFNDNLKNNFRKIISNIFYLNSKRVYIEYERLRKTEKMNGSTNIKFIQDLYMSFLEKTRAQVCEFYKIEEDSLITVKTQLRSYIFLLEDKSEDHVWYKNADQQLLKIEENLTFGIVPEEFICDKESFNVVDEVIELERLVRNTFDMSTVEI